jgi:steroid delta-isomerase-like uncharacterized protein
MPDSTTPHEVPTGLDRRFVEQFRERLLAVWNDHDTTDLPNLVTDDVVWTDPMMGDPARGVQGVRQFMEACFRSTPDLHFDLTGPLCFADDAPWVMAQWKMTGTHLGAFDPPGFAPTGCSFAIDGVDMYTFRGEKVTHYQARYDIAELMRQLGILPGRGSRGEKILVAMQRLAAKLRGQGR